MLKKFIQLDFLAQKSTIKKNIIGKTGAFIGYKILFYPKFYCKINHIEYF